MPMPSQTYVSGAVAAPVRVAAPYGRLEALMTCVRASVRVRAGVGWRAVRQVGGADDDRDGEAADAGRAVRHVLVREVLLERCEEAVKLLGVLRLCGHPRAHLRWW